jgi:hypothetical protein
MVSDRKGERWREGGCWKEILPLGGGKLLNNKNKMPYAKGRKRRG